MDNLSYGKLPIIGALGWMVKLLQRLQLLITLRIKAFASIIQYLSLNKLKLILCHNGNSFHGYM